MGLFNLSDGSKVGGEKEYDASEGFGKPLPDNTEVLASCTAIEWSEYEGTENIRSTWTIVLPAEHKDRKIFYTFKVNDKNSDKADKAKRMVGAIDATHGGKLAKIYDEEEREPTDEELGRALLSKLMVLKIGYYDMTDKGGKEGNYIKAVSPRKAGAIAEEVVKKSNKKVAPPKTPDFDGFDDDIPF